LDFDNWFTDAPAVFQLLVLKKYPNLGVDFFWDNAWPGFRFAGSLYTCKAFSQLTWLKLGKNPPPFLAGQATYVKCQTHFAWQFLGSFAVVFPTRFFQGV